MIIAMAVHIKAVIAKGMGTFAPLLSGGAVDWERYKMKSEINIFCHIRINKIVWCILIISVQCLTLLSLPLSLLYFFLSLSEHAHLPIDYNDTRDDLKSCSHFY